MTRAPRQHSTRWIVAAIAHALLVAGCHRDMYDQPRLDTLESSTFFKDGRAARPRVPGTVVYQAPWPGDVRYTGRAQGELATEIPLEVNAALLKRGRQRFEIFCSNCHSRTGDGDGMIVQRGYTQPPTFHSDRLRRAPVGHLFEVMTNGFGVMPSYATQTSADDRWAIAAYVRALQWSRHATVEDLTPEQRTRLEALPGP